MAVFDQQLESQLVFVFLFANKQTSKKKTKQNKKRNIKNPRNKNKQTNKQAKTKQNKTKQKNLGLSMGNLRCVDYFWN